MVAPERGAWAAALADWLADLSPADPPVVTNQAQARCYSWEMVAGRYLDLYRRALAGQHG